MEMASATVLEVKRQGNVLEKTDRSIETVGFFNPQKINGVKFIFLMDSRMIRYRSRKMYTRPVE